MLAFNKVFVLVAVLFKAASVQADIIAWGENDCTGSQGGDAPCTGICVPFGDRHSFKAGTNLLRTIISNADRFL
ncbi:hypothetical protein C8J56DRAFT_784996 [Mycena floridula]|nr:hypothetical protein C8J56DRAFT_784996 [Mycena floridula]